jgi:hypothetical protein
MRREIVIDRATLRHSCDLRVAGTICRVFTNSRKLGETLRRWQATGIEKSSPGLSLHILVDRGGGAGTAPPHFRGLEHLVIASFGEENVFVFDVARRRVTGTVTEDIAADRTFWHRILLPITIGVLGPAVGVVPVHAACMVADGEGTLIAGASGVGKSTLSIALAQGGFGYVSDDWTYLTLERGRLLAHGMEVPAKLLPDALEHFPFLAEYRVGIALNQEPAYEVPAQDVGARVESWCAPRSFIFLERSGEEGCRLAPVPAVEARRYIERSVERLPPQLENMIQARSVVIEQVALLSCWKLSYSGPPQIAVSALQNFFAQQRQGVAI